MNTFLIYIIGVAIAFVLVTLDYFHYCKKMNMQAIMDKEDIVDLFYISCGSWITVLMLIFSLIDNNEE